MAFNLFKHLMPHEEAFTPLFCEQPQCIAQAANELRRMIRGDGPSGQRHVAAIREIEVAADAVPRRIFIAANRTFNAPIDREDILALAHVLDDCVDLIEDTAKEIQRYGVVDFAKYVTFGASPRASIHLIEGARALAYLGGRDYVLPDDVSDLAPDVFPHRLVLSYEALADGLTPDQLVHKIMQRIPPPDKPLESHVRFASQG